MVQEVGFPPPVVERLAACVDRFFEARFFLGELITLPVERDSLGPATWYLSAHLAAVISIEDAGAADFRRLGIEDRFRNSPLGLEFRLRSDDTDPITRDPLSTNRAYRDLRNLRVHHSVPLIELADRVLEPAIQANVLDSGELRWFMRPIQLSEHSQLRSKALTQREIERLNEYWRTRPLVSFLAQHLYTMHGVLIATAG